ERIPSGRGPITHRFLRACPMSANPLAWSFRSQFLLGLLCCLGLLGYALYVQYQLFLEPCPLCIFQRVAFFAAAAVFLLGLLHNPGRTGRRVYGVLAALATLAGAGIAGRHVW